MTANLHVALALALGLPTSLTDQKLIDEVYALRERTGDYRYPVSTSRGPRRDPDEPIPGLDELGGAS